MSDLGSAGHARRVAISAELTRLEESALYSAQNQFEQAKPAVDLPIVNMIIVTFFGRRRGQSRLSTRASMEVSRVRRAASLLHGVEPQVRQSAPVGRDEESMGKASRKEGGLCPSKLTLE